MRIVKKILKWALRLVLIVIGFLLLLCILVYIPPIQNFIKNKAAAYVSKNMGFQLEIERLRLRFPLGLSIDNTVLTLPAGDTLMRVGELRAGVALLPLLGGAVEVRTIKVGDAAVNYSDSTGSMTIRGTLGELGVRNTRLRLKDKHVEVGDITIADADIFLGLGGSQPDTAAVATDTIPWRIEAGRFDVERLRFNMRTSPDVTELAVDLPAGRIDDVDADLREQLVNVKAVKLDGGNYSYLTDTVTVAAPPADTLSAAVPRPWTVHVARVELAGNAGTYGTLYAQPQPGFDPSYIQVAGLSALLDSIYYSGSDISANIRGLALKERSGLEVVSAEGRFVMDSAKIELSGFDLRTAASDIKVDVGAGAAALGMENTWVRARLDADVASSDIFLFYPAEGALRGALDGKVISFYGNIRGELDALDIERLQAEVPGNLSLDASGTVRSLLDPDNLGADIKLDGRFADVGFVRDFLPDSLRRRVGFPGNMSLSGTLLVDGGIYQPDLVFVADSGRIDIKGHVNLPAESYDADIAAANFPLHSFLPTDSLGLLTLGLTAKGRGFDFTAPATEAQAALNISRFDYKGFNHHDIALDAALAENRVSGVLAADNDALQLNIGIDGEISAEKYAAHLKGRIDKADVMQMRLSSTPLAVSGVLDITASASPDTTQMIYALDAALDSMRLTHGDHTDAIARTTVKASADLAEVKAEVRSGDLSLDFYSPVSLMTFTDGITRVMDTLMNQVEVRDINFAPAEAVMPPFRLEAFAGRNNIAHGFLSEAGMGYNNISLTAYNADTTAFRIRGLVTGFSMGGLTLDTLNMGVGQRDERLTYFVRLANRPGNIEQLALIYLYGTVAGDSIQANFNQRNREGEKGFVFGVNARLQDSSIRASLFPEHPVFAYEHWMVNPDNFLEYRFNGEMYANLDLEKTDAFADYSSHVKIHSVDYAMMPRGSVRLDIENLDIARTLDLMPAPPAVGGLLTTNVAFGMDGPLIAANGSVAVKGLTYDRQRVGDVSLLIPTFNSDDSGIWNIDAGLDINGKSAFTARGTYNLAGSGAMDLDLAIPDLPLNVANAFLPSDMAKLSGGLHGGAKVTGTPSALNIGGSLGFDGAQLEIPMIGTAFGISAEPIRIADNRMRLREFGLTSPNGQLLSLDGTVDISDFSKINTNLNIWASNFQVVNAPRNRGSQVYGLAAVDVDMTARGVVDALAVRGDVKVLRTTDVVYTMMDSPLSVESQKQDLVTFISFADSLAMARQDSLVRVRTGGMDVQVSVDIEDDVQATVNLSDNGNDRIELVGGGNLTYTMSSQGDMRLTGRYALTGGTVVYNLPFIPPKNFSIDDNSYVAFTGELAEPEFNIRAVQTVQTTVTSGDTSRPVNFNIIIYVTGSLANMDITFDLTAADQTIQNELAGMAAEERSTQALALMIYNTYTGPSSTAQGNTNNALYSFLEKEINQWARNSLKGVDVSFGIDTAEDAKGNEHMDYSYKVSKSLFDDRVKVTIGGSLSDNASLSQNLNDSFIDDVSLEYRLTKRDNMFLKAYRYTTNDLLEGEVVETGGGFLVRKRMERLRDLFKVTADPVKRQMREQRRMGRDSVRRQEQQIIRDTSRRYNRTPEQDSARRARWEARRDSMARDSTYRPRPRDPRRFDSIPGDSVRMRRWQPDSLRTRQPGERPYRRDPQENGNNDAGTVRRNDEAVKEEE